MMGVKAKSRKCLLFNLLLVIGVSAVPFPNPLDFDANDNCKIDAVEFVATVDSDAVVKGMAAGMGGGGAIFGMLAKGPPTTESKDYILVSEIKANVAVTSLLEVSAGTPGKGSVDNCNEDGTRKPGAPPAPTEPPTAAPTAPPPPVPKGQEKFTLGFLLSYNVEPRYFSAVALADFDFRSQFDPDLQARGFKPTNPVENLHPDLKLGVRPVTGDDTEHPLVGMIQSYRLIAVEKVHGIVGPVTTAVSEVAGMFGSSQEVPVIVTGAQDDSLSDKTLYPYLFRMSPPSSRLQVFMAHYMDFFQAKSASIFHTGEPFGDGSKNVIVDYFAASDRIDFVKAISMSYKMPTVQAECDERAQALKDAGNRLVNIIVHIGMMDCAYGAMKKIDLRRPYKKCFPCAGPIGVGGSCAEGCTEWEGGEDGIGYQLVGSIATPRAPLAGFETHHFISPYQNPYAPAATNFMANYKNMLAEEVKAMGKTASGSDVYSTDGWTSNFMSAMPYNPDTILQSSFSDPLGGLPSLVVPLVYTAYATYIHAFNALLNQGLTPDQIRGSPLQLQIRKTSTVEAVQFGTLCMNEKQDACLAAAYMVAFQMFKADGEAVYLPFFTAKDNPGTPIAVAGFAAYGGGLWADGSRDLSSPPKNYFECLPGSKLSRKENGYCVPCNPGTVSNNYSLTQCEACTANSSSYDWKAGLPSSTKCTVCPAGSMSASAGVSQCAKCTQGTYTSQVAASQCDRCPHGRFSNTAGTSNCTVCPKEGFTTKETGSTTAAMCLCGENQYRTRGDQCASCPPGMECPIGSAESCFRNLSADVGIIPVLPPGDVFNDEYETCPLVNPGHYTISKEDPLSVYLCDPLIICPGGATPNSCAGDRQKFMCIECPDGSVPTSTLEDDVPGTGCQECLTTHLIYLIGAPVIGIAALIFVLRETKNSPLDDTPLFIELQGVTGQIVMFLQILGAMAAANLSMGTPYTGFMADLSSPVDLDVFFISTPCISPVFVDSVVSFAVQLTMPLVFALILSGTVFLFNTWKKGFFKCDGLFNSIGEILIEFYVSITIAVLQPMNCYEHPNGKTSMETSPEILCGEGDHNMLMVLSGIALLIYPINCFVITCTATWMHPRRMAKNDIGHLVRCHFLFNRWKPSSYWFVVVAVTRNFLIALWPMVISDKDIAVMLMIVTLTIPLLWGCWEKPRRTPATNKLDLHISFCQAMILGVGAMSVYSGDLESQALSYALLFLTTSVFVVAGLIVFLKGSQLAAGKVEKWFGVHFDLPWAWSFDVFIDHHAGGGANGARILQVFMSSTVKKRKVFFDIDQWCLNQSLPVILDACKLSKNCLVVMGNETWCRSWCVGSIVAATSMHIPIQTIAVEGAAFDVVSADMDEQVINMFAKQAPRETLRPLGLSDQEIPIAMKKVFKLKPTWFSMKDHKSMTDFFTTIVGGMKGVQYQKKFKEVSTNPSAVENITRRYFSKADITENETVTPWYGVDQDFVLISSDWDDPDAVSVSRLCYKMLQELVTLVKEKERKSGRVSGGMTQTGSGTATPLGSFDSDAGAKRAARSSVDSFNASALSSQERSAVRGINCLEDVDLEATELKELVESGRIPLVIVILTANSLHSAPQLLRLGFMHKYASPDAAFSPIPLAISDAFTFPGVQLLEDIENGRALTMPSAGEELRESGYLEVIQSTSVKYTTVNISMTRVRAALSQVLETRITLIDIPRVGNASLRSAMLKVLFRSIHAIEASRNAPAVQADRVTTYGTDPLEDERPSLYPKGRTSVTVEAQTSKNAMESANKALIEQKGVEEQGVDKDEILIIDEGAAAAPASGVVVGETNVWR